MPLPSFSEDIEKNIIRHIKYRGTIRTGEIIVDNGDGTYDVKIALSDVVYPSIETVHYEMGFAVGEIAVLAFEYGSKENPKIIGHGKKIAQIPVEIVVDYSGTARVETLDAYSIVVSSAYLEGRIHLGGAGNCTRRGFYYGTSTGYGSDAYSTGSFAAGSYNEQVTELDSDTTYHFQAYVIDVDDNEQVGEDKTFLASAAVEDHIYCAGVDTCKVWKINPSDMSRVAESADHGGNIYALTILGNYIYYGGYISDRVCKIRISDMVKVAESAIYGGNIYALTVLGNYVYCAGSATNKVWKIRISDMVKVAESADYTHQILALTNDGTYIYCGGYTPTTRKIWKIDPSDMSKVDESIDCEANIQALTVLGSYVYCGLGLGVRKVWRLGISDMVKVAESDSYGDTNGIYSLTNDGTYLYCGGHVDQKVWKIDPSDMSKIAESADYGATVSALTALGNYIYCGGAVTQKVWKIRISDMVKVAESVDYGGQIRGLVTD